MRSHFHRGFFLVTYCFIVTLCNICLESSSPPPARHISLLLNSHRSSDSHHYTFPKIPSYHHFFVIVPSGSMQISSARATPYQRARRAVRARAALNQHARQQICLYRNTNINAPTHAKPARALPYHRVPLHTSVGSVHVCIYFPNIH